MFEENKQDICDKLAELLKSTDYWHDIERIVYEPETEYAVVHFKECEPISVNIARDSGKAIISDVLRSIS